MDYPTDLLGYIITQQAIFTCSFTKYVYVMLINKKSANLWTSDYSSADIFDLGQIT